MSKHPGTTVVFGGQAGSEGKGAIVGYLARKHQWSAAICSFMTNAGHSWVGDDGSKVVVQQVPMAVVSHDIPHLMIGPGSAITLSQLEKELNELDKLGFDASSRLRIHPRAMIIEDSDAEFEHTATRYLGSTAKGCGRALARKVMRLRDVRLARDISWLQFFLCDTTELVNDYISRGEPVLIEGSQGFDLDLNHGIEYPYCTSRGTTPAQTLADCGIAPVAVENTIATLRTYPIRVGNIVENGVQIGYSGPFGGKELTWEEVTKRSGSPEPLHEITTVTKRTRRVFEMDVERLRYMIAVTRPTSIALTFADYLDHSIKDMNTEEFIVQRRALGMANDFVVRLEDELGIDIDFLKTGPRDGAIIDLYGVSR